jgi:hypothetical protein
MWNITLALDMLPPYYETSTAAMASKIRERIDDANGNAIMHQDECCGCEFII